MSKNNLTIATVYYTAMSEKNIGALEKHLHPDVQFSAPLAKVKGKEAVLESTKGFANFFKSLKIRAKLGTGDQAMIVYDLECPEPVGNVTSASLMTFQDGLITKIELFYDARPFVK